MSVSLATQAIDEFVAFITSLPNLEEIVAYHTSAELADRIYALVAAEKTGAITAEEQHELDHVETMEYIVICAKAEALRKLQARAS